MVNLVQRQFLYNYFLGVIQAWDKIYIFQKGLKLGAGSWKL